MAEGHPNHDPHFLPACHLHLRQGKRIIQKSGPVFQSTWLPEVERGRNGDLCLEKGSLKVWIREIFIWIFFIAEVNIKMLRGREVISPVVEVRCVGFLKTFPEPCTL